MIIRILFRMLRIAVFRIDDSLKYKNLKNEVRYAALFFYNVRVKCVKRGQSLCVKLDTKGLSPFDTLYPS